VLAVALAMLSVTGSTAAQAAISASSRVPPVAQGHPAAVATRQLADPAGTVALTLAAAPQSEAAAGAATRPNDVIVHQQAFPVLFILGLLARLGIKYVIRWYGKAQVKKAAKSYLLNSVNAKKWGHIMAPKHKWSSVDARSKEQVAELMSRAMAEGKHVVAANNRSVKATWNYRGKTIDVTYAKDSGKISNGWVR
jgi:hypothetical protein